MDRKSRGKKKKNEKNLANEREGDKEYQLFDDIIVNNDTAKDFAFLMNAPISEDDHFIFKSEKGWTVDANEYSEYFTLDLKTLSAAIESIPFIENVSIDNKYFTSDQVANIYNEMEIGKQNYKKVLETLEAQDVNKRKDIEESQVSTEDTMEDLDFLLSLQDPIPQPSGIVIPPSTSYVSDSKSIIKSAATSEDLEKWLDFVLDD